VSKSLGEIGVVQRELSVMLVELQLELGSTTNSVVLVVVIPAQLSTSKVKVYIPAATPSGILTTPPDKVAPVPSSFARSLKRLLM